MCYFVISELSSICFPQVLSCVHSLYIFAFLSLVLCPHHWVFISSSLPLLGCVLLKVIFTSELLFFLRGGGEREREREREIKGEREKGRKGEREIENLCTDSGTRTQEP